MLEAHPNEPTSIHEGHKHCLWSGGRQLCLGTLAHSVIPRTWTYPIWTLLISAPLSQASARLLSSLLGYFSQVCHVKLHIISSQPRFPTMPNKPHFLGPIFFHPAVLLPWGKAPHYMGVCHKRWGGCWGAHFTGFTATLLGPEMRLGGEGFPCLAEGWELHEPLVLPCWAHQPPGAVHRLPLPTGQRVSHQWRGTQLSSNPGRVFLIRIPSLIFLILTLPNRGLPQFGMLHQSKAFLTQCGQVHICSPEWIWFLWWKLLKLLLSPQQENSLQMIW